VQKVHIRPLLPSDVDAVVEIAIAAWKPIIARLRQEMGDELFMLARPDWQQEKARRVRKACAPDSSAIVAVAEVAQISGQATRVAGFCTCYARPALGIGEIGNNAVHPDWQGRGIAARLYQYAFEQLRERGMRYVQVRTGGGRAHAPARRAYQKAGFDVALPQVEYYRKL
jgi:ribosomal protein S18 acetylase RimI-like enzyme